MEDEDLSKANFLIIPVYLKSKFGIEYRENFLERGIFRNNSCENQNNFQNAFENTFNKKNKQSDDSSKVEKANKKSIPSYPRIDDYKIYWRAKINKYYIERIN